MKAGKWRKGGVRVLGLFMNIILLMPMVTSVERSLFIHAAAVGGRFSQNSNNTAFLSNLASRGIKMGPSRECSVAAGFEPALPLESGFQVHRLNHSAKPPR